MKNKPEEEQLQTENESVWLAKITVFVVALVAITVGVFSKKHGLKFNGWVKLIFGIIFLAIVYDIIYNNRLALTLKTLLSR